MEPAPVPSPEQEPEPEPEPGPEPEPRGNGETPGPDRDVIATGNITPGSYGWRELLYYTNGSPVTDYGIHSARSEWCLDITANEFETQVFNDGVLMVQKKGAWEPGDAANEVKLHVTQHTETIINEGHVGAPRGTEVIEVEDIGEGSCQVKWMSWLEGEEAMVDADDIVLKSGYLFSHSDPACKLG
jgi:hypothetical protein